MNRVFKVIWNRTKGCYVVVAETAKNMTKRSSLSVVFSKMVGATALAVMLTGVMMPTDALGVDRLKMVSTHKLKMTVVSQLVIAQMLGVLILLLSVQVQKQPVKVL